MNFIDKIETKIEKFFTWLNKDAETPKEGFAQSAVALALFILFFVVVGYATTFIGA